MATGINQSIPVTVNASTTANSFGIVQNGAALSATNTVSVAGNTPTAVTIDAFDSNGNPIMPSNEYMVDLSALATIEGGEFHATANGGPISEIAIPAGAAGVTVNIVSSTATTLNTAAKGTADLGYAFSTATANETLTAQGVTPGP